MSYTEIIKKLDKNEPYLDHKNAVLSAPIRHLFMIGTVEYLSRKTNKKSIKIL